MDKTYYKIDNWIQLKISDSDPQGYFLGTVIYCASAGNLKTRL